MARTRVSKNRPPSLNPYSRPSNSPSPSIGSFEPFSTDAAVAAAIVNDNPVQGYAGYPDPTRFVEKILPMTHEKLPRKLLTAPELALVARLFDEKDFFTSHANLSLRRWVRDHLSRPPLPSTNTPGPLTYRNRGVLIPLESVYETIMLAHGSGENGHAGRDKTTRFIKRNGEWVLKSLVEVFIGMCPTCCARQNSRGGGGVGSGAGSASGSGSGSGSPSEASYRRDVVLIPPPTGSSRNALMPTGLLAPLPGSSATVQGFHHARQISNASSTSSVFTSSSALSGSTDEYTPPSRSEVQPEPAFAYPSPAAFGYHPYFDCPHPHHALPFPHPHPHPHPPAGYPTPDHNPTPFTPRLSDALHGSANDTLAAGYDPPAPDAPPAAYFARMLALEHSLSGVAFRNAVEAEADPGLSGLGIGSVDLDATAAGVVLAPTVGNSNASGSDYVGSASLSPTNSSSGSSLPDGMESNTSFVPQIQTAVVEYEVPMEVPSMALGMPAVEGRKSPVGWATYVAEERPAAFVDVASSPAWVEAGWH